MVAGAEKRASEGMGVERWGRRAVSPVIRRRGKGTQA